MLYADAGEWHVWAWKNFDSLPKENYCTRDWRGKFIMTAGSGEYTYTLKEVDSSAKLGIIFAKVVNGGVSTQTNEIIVPKDKLTDNKNLYFAFSPKGTDMPIYESAADCKRP